MFCSNCGQPINNTPFCSNCGAKVMMSTETIDTIIKTQEQAAVQAPAEPAPVQAPVQEAAPAQPVQPVQPPVQEAAPVQPPVQQPQAEPIQTTFQPPVSVQQVKPEQIPMTSAPQAAPKKRSKKPLIIVLSIVGGVIILSGIAVAGVIGYRNYAVSQKYNEAKEAFDNGQYVVAKEMFTELEDYEDSEYMAKYCQVEIDSKNIDARVEAKDYSGAIDLLNKRKDFFGSSSSEGKEADELIEDYANIINAYDAMKDKDYALAVRYFDSIKKAKVDYTSDRNYCNVLLNADNAKSDKNWIGIIANLYGLQIQDYELNYLAAPKNDQEQLIADAYNSGEPGDYNALADLIDPPDDDQLELKTYAVKGFKYDDAVKIEEKGNYEEAMALFQEIGDFLDASTHYKNCKTEKEKIEKLKKTYEDAEQYFNNGEYYKAMKLYNTIPDYKDSKTKASQCEQDLPANGSKKKNYGSGVSMKIVAPSDKSVFLKFYDSNGNAVAQIFIRAGKNAKVKLKAGTYTIKVGYGTQWYGDIDLFGEEAIYSQLLNGSSPDFKLKRNYTYTLKLMVTKNGNVGSSGVPGGAGGM